MRISSLLTTIRTRIVRQFSRTRDPLPLVSHKHDVTILQSLRGRRIPSVPQWVRLPGLLTAREKRLFSVASVVLVCSLVWFGYGIATSRMTIVPAVGGHYIEAIVGSPQRINPLFASINDADIDISRLVYSGLMRHTPEQRLVPDLATKYEVSEDRKTYTFTLRENARWHDGEPFTADDVVYTFQELQDPAVGSPLLVSFQGILVEKIDDYVIRFSLPEAFPAFLSTLTVGILPEHIWLTIPAEQMRLSQKNIQPVGTGPYKFSKLVKDERGQILRYDLVRFEDWYRQAPYIETFSFAFYGFYDGPGGAIQDVREKKVDGLNFVPYDLKQEVDRKHIQLHTLQLPQYTALLFNQKKQPLLEKAELRDALAFSLDKDRILRETLEHEGQVIYSPILPGFPGYDADREKTVYNVEEANASLDDVYKRLSVSERRQALLDKAIETYQADHPVVIATTTDEGEVDLTESVESVEVSAEVMTQLEESVDAQIDPAQPFFRTDKDGEVISLSLVTSDTTEYRQAAQLIASMWQEIGIVTNISLVPAKEMSRAVLKDRSYDILLYGMIVGADPDQYPFWHSSQVAFPGLNLSQYVNRSADTLLEKARETTDEGEQTTLYTEFQDLLLADRPAIFLYIPTYTYALGGRVQGFDVTRISHPADRFDGVEMWYIKTKRAWRK